MVELKNWKRICEEKDRRIEELENKFDEIVGKLKEKENKCKDCFNECNDNEQILCSVIHGKIVGLQEAVEVVKGVKNE